MRVDPAVLLVILAIALPFIVQLKTIAGFVGYNMSVSQHAVIGAVVVLAIVVWGVWPEGGVSS